MKQKKLFLFLLMVTLLLAQCVDNQKGKELKLAHGLPVGHPVSEAMEFLAQRCGEISSGELTIKIYPSGQLGSEQQNVELLQLGSLAMTKVSAAVLEGFSEDYKALGLPYIFRDKKHYFNVCDSEIGNDILLSTEKKWLRGLCFFDAGSRSFYSTKKQIKTPDDLKGMKIRVMKSKTAMNMVDALGGSPTPLSWGELYTALQSGVVDGAENNPPTFFSSHHFEVCKYYTLDEHASIPDVLIMSQVIWDKLAPKEKKYLQLAVKETVVKQRALWAAAEEEALTELKKAGVIVFEPQKTLYSDKVSSMYESYKSRPTVYDYITRIKNLK